MSGSTTTLNPRPTGPRIHRDRSTGRTSVGETIFGIGLNKTGTHSVAAALRILGFTVLHYGDRDTAKLVIRADPEDLPLLTYVGEDYDAYFDIEPLVNAFSKLDEQYPGSRFVLTTRDADSWLASRRRHVEANQERAARGLYSGDFLVIDERAWLAAREEHHSAVIRYFAGRSNLLVFDVTDGWEPLVGFLGVETPDQPFPWKNRAGVDSYSMIPTRRSARAVNRLKRALRR